MTLEVAFEESRVNHAKKHTHKLVLQVCRKQAVHRKGTVAVKAEHTIPRPQQYLLSAEHGMIYRD